MPRAQRKASKKKKYILLGVVFAFFLISFWPLRALLAPSFVFSKHLLILTNEAETRPCGGFVTAYGTFREFPPHIKIENVYNLEGQDFGPATFPLSEIAKDKNFWDLGDTPDMQECAIAFRDAYKQINGKRAKPLFISIRSVETLLKTLGPIQLGGQSVDETNIFAILSRSVSDVDRHNVQALANRKNILKPLSRKIFTKVAISPYKWRKIAKTTRKLIKEGEIYIPGISPEILFNNESFGIIEWNLGGAKSSRVLEKNYSLDLRETSPLQWEITINFEAHHRGGQDEPLSQTWSGAFEFLLPSFLKKEDEKGNMILTTLEPGESYSFQQSLSYEGNISSLNLFKARSQDIFAQVSISLYPQQSFTKSNFETRESVGSFRSTLPNGKTSLTWDTNKDSLPPFITFHEVIDPNIFPPEISQNFDPSNQLIVEIHLNENIQPIDENFSASATDLDMGDISAHEDLELANLYQFPDKPVLLLGFRKREEQNEFYTLTVQNIQDIWGNKLFHTEKTIVKRQSSYEAF